MNRQADIERLARFIGLVREGSAWRPREWEEPDTVPANVISTRPFYYDFDPFTRLDDAMMVAEKIGTLALVQCRPNEKWSAHFNLQDEADSLTPICDAAKAAEAIALAALAYLDATGFK